MYPTNSTTPSTLLGIPEHLLIHAVMQSANHKAAAKESLVAAAVSRKGNIFQIPPILARGRPEWNLILSCAIVAYLM